MSPKGNKFLTCGEKIFHGMNIKEKRRRNAPTF
jgi:hypothetical protein